MSITLLHRLKTPVETASKGAQLTIKDIYEVKFNIDANGILSVLEAKALVEEVERALGEKGEITRNEERLESVKADAVCALVGTLVAVPIILIKNCWLEKKLLFLGLFYFIFFIISFVANCTN